MAAETDNCNELDQIADVSTAIHQPPVTGPSSAAVDRTDPTTANLGASTSVNYLTTGAQRGA